MSETLSQNFGIRQTANLQIPGRGHTYSGVFSLVSASGLSFNLMTAAPTGAGLTLQQVDQIKGAFVDNSAGTVPFVLGTNAGDAKSIPPGFQGTMPLYLPNDGILYLTGNGTVRLTLLNVDTPMAVWSASGSEGTVTISGTVPVSAASLPLPTGAATAANQTPGVAAGSASSLALPVQGIAGGTAVPISAAALPLPTGAATAANQAAPTSAGTNSTTGLPVQGIQGGILVPTGASGFSISLTPTVQAATYATGIVIGGLLTFANATRTGSLSGLIQAVRATFASGITPSLDFIPFNANPASSTITDKTALAIAGADLSKVLPTIQLTNAISLGTPSMMQAVQQAYEFVLASGTTLYGCVVQRTAAGVTLGSTTDMIVEILGVQQ